MSAYRTNLLVFILGRLFPVINYEQPVRIVTDNQSRLQRQIYRVSGCGLDQAGHELQMRRTFPRWIRKGEETEEREEAQDPDQDRGVEVPEREVKRVGINRCSSNSTTVMVVVITVTRELMVVVVVVETLLSFEDPHLTVCRAG